MVNNDWQWKLPFSKLGIVRRNSNTALRSTPPFKKERWLLCRPMWNRIFWWAETYVFKISV